MTLAEIIAALAKMERGPEFDRLWTNLGEIVREVCKRQAAEAAEEEQS